MDMRFEKDLTGKLDSKVYDAIGIAVPFTTSINTCNRILKLVHEHSPNIIKIIGGHYPSTSVSKIELQYVDYLVTGEGVHTITELLDKIINKEDVREVSGIAVIQDGKAYYTAERAYSDLDLCHFPARHLLSRFHNDYFHAHYKPITLMRFSVGCPYDCSFCILWKMTNRKYYTRSARSILDELGQIANQNIYVVDDEAFIQAKRMMDLADDIIRSGIKKKFHMYVRSDTIVNNPELFEKWSQAGLDSVLVGLESIFNDDLEGYHKKISHDIARKCVKILHDNNIEIRANFIIKPDYTLDKFRKVRESIIELDIDRPTFAVLTPFIGTDEYVKVKDELILNNPEFYDCYHTLVKTAMPIKTFYKEFADLFRIAQQRDQSKDNKKIFYSGKGNSFNSFVEKIENSYMYYS
jgi:methyltransferase